MSGEPLDVGAIRERAEAATPGPWDHERTRSGWTVGWHEEGEPGWLCDLGIANGEPDAEFIAHAREDVPALLSELEASRERERRLREALGQALRQWKHYADTDRQFEPLDLENGTDEEARMYRGLLSVCRRDEGRG